MFAWIEAGRCNTFVSVGSKDVVFRTATLDNNIVIGNDCNATGAAALYVHENRLGVRRIPMAGANVDITGNLAVSRALKIYDVSDGRSNFSNISHSHAALTHSNISLCSATGGQHVYADATGLLTANTMVLQHLTSTSNTFSNVVVLNATEQSNSSSASLKLLLQSEYGQVGHDTFSTKGAHLVIGNTPYHVVDVNADSNATSITLKTTTPDGLLVKDTRISDGSLVDIQVLTDRYDTPISSKSWDTSAVVLAQCDFQSAKGGRTLQLFVENVGSASYSHLRRLVGAYVAMGKSPSSFAIVKLIDVQSQMITATEYETIVSFSAPDGSAAFAAELVSRLQLSFGATVQVRQLKPLHDAEREFTLENAKLVQYATEMRPVRDDSGGGNVGQGEEIAIMSFELDTTNDEVVLLTQTLAAAAGGVNALVRGAMIGGNLTDSERFSVYASHFDSEMARITVETLSSEVSVLPAINGMYALRLRTCGARILVTRAILIDDRSASIDVSFQDSDDMTQLLQQHAGTQATFLSMPTLFGGHSCALKMISASIPPGSTNTSSLRIAVRHVDHGFVQMDPVSVDARLSLFAPVNETHMYRDAVRLESGASVGRNCSAATGHHALSVDGGIHVRNDIHFADSFASDLDMRLTYTSNVMNFSFVPSVIPHEKSPNPMLPFMTLSSSNMHLRTAMVVDGQVTAKHVRTTSDARLKTNIIDSKPEHDLDALMQIPIRRFDFIDDIHDNDTAKSRHVGVLAQDVARVIPSAVGSTSGFISLSNTYAVLSVDRKKLNLTAANIDIADGDVIKWRASCRAAGVSHVTHAHVGAESASLVLKEPIPLDVATSGSTLQIMGKMDKLKVIDTTELLCLTMNALKEVHRDLQTLRGQVNVLRANNV